MQGCKYRPCSIGRAVQDLHYTQGFTGLALFVGLHRPCYIPKAELALHYICRNVLTLHYICRNVLTLHYTHGCAGPSLYTGLHRPCTIDKAVHAMHYSQVFVGPVVYAGL